MANDYETRLDRLEAAKGIGIPQILVLMPSEDEASSGAEFRRERGLSANDPVQVIRVVYPEWPVPGK